MIPPQDSPSSAKGRSYSFYGCRLQSTLPLSLIRESPGECAPEVSLIRGEVPESLPDPVWTSPFASISAGGSVLLGTNSVARFLLEGGRTITVQVAAGARAVEVEALLAGPVAGALLHQRGMLPLHASCVDTGQGAVALTGSVGRGKSTIATALTRRGARLMSDDICPVRFDPELGPMAIPGSAGLRLWPDSHGFLGCESAGWLPICDGQLKRIGPAPSLPSGPRRLRAVVRLVADGRLQPTLRRLEGPVAAGPISDLVYRFAFGHALGRTEELFLGVTRLADQIPVFEVRRPDGFAHLDTVADMILAAVSGII